MIDIDHPAIEVGSRALDGHHPERGGPERDQAVFAVIEAIIKAGYLVEPSEEQAKKFREAGPLEERVKNVLRPYQNLTLDYGTGHRLLGDLLAAVRGDVFRSYQEGSALEMTLEELDIEVRTYNNLRRAGISTFDPISKILERGRSWVEGIPQMGEHCMQDLDEALENRGLKLEDKE